MITKYGYNTLGIIAILCFVLVVIAVYSNAGIVKYSLYLISLLFLVFSINFFRDPDRIIPDGNGIIVSPADGKVLIVKEIVSNKFFTGKAWQISIFMSPLNVHVNRIPINGKIDYLKYIKGEYLVAYHDKADERNERSEIGISSEYGPVFFTQVAGFIARRIVYELNIGQQVTMGDRFGMIKFGSRVDVIVPQNWNILVSEGDIVKAGETILYGIDK